MNERNTKEETFFNRITELETENVALKAEVLRLKGLLERAGLDYSIENSMQEDAEETLLKNCIINENITKEQIDLFITLFHGRTDVYAKRFISKAGNVGYSPACHNFWRYGICPKRNGLKIKCAECSERDWVKLTRRLLRGHLEGPAEDGTDVIGIYPMLEDETCYFLVFDFDNHDKKKEVNEDEGANEDSDWIEDVNAMRKICENNNIDLLVERSRSGQGAHVWIFFKEAIPVALARRFGLALLTKGADSVNQKNFRSYDRMLPAQDKMPEGGLGNLIALPLQGQALRKGNSAFIDEGWKVISDPWTLMISVKKLSKQAVEEMINEWTPMGILGILSDDMSGEKAEENESEKPWEKKKQPLIFPEDVAGTVEIVLANQIYIKNHNIKPRTLNRFRRLAAFSNPEFYKKQAMGFSTKGVPRIIQCSADTKDYVCLPRGIQDNLIGLLKESGIVYKVSDKKQNGYMIDVQFSGNLYPEQEKAAKCMLQYDYGILGAATGFGKTVIGAYLISQRKRNAIVLVHNREIMKNWIDDLEKFLFINEAFPEYETKKGKRKRKTLIGKLYAGHDSLGGIVDVAMITSFGKRDDIDERIKDYGLVIVDECHHASAQTHEAVIRQIGAKYVYGLTATPKREDGHEQSIYMQFGPIRYRLSARDRAKMQNFEHFVRPRFTSMVNTTGIEWGINEAYRELVINDRRNKLIIDDVVECVKKGRTPLVLTKFKDHAGMLVQVLADKADYVFLLQGGRSNREREEIQAQLRGVSPDASLILVAIGKYIGEGFNCPRLDTMMLAVPIAWQGNVEQYAGRLHRDYEGKTDVIIYDYVDSHIKVLERMYHKRLRAYKKIGYKITLGLNLEKQKVNAIFDGETYRSVYESDLNQANLEIVISSPGINQPKTRWFLRTIYNQQLQGIRVSILTIPSAEYPDSRVEQAGKLINQLKDAGVYVKETPGLHEHFAVIDKEIVWYGSMNLLSGEKEDDSMIRVQSQEIAEELLETIFIKDRQR